MADAEILRRLDAIIAILQLAHREEISSARATIRTDKVNAAILDATKKWTRAAKLLAALAKKTPASSSTIHNRISDLLVLGVLEKQGGGPTTEYRATGLI